MPSPYPVVDSAFIEQAEALASQHKLHIEIEDVAPVYVPEDYQIETLYGATRQAGKAFDNGSTIHLMLLPF